MAVKNRILGKNAFLYKGTVLIGCAKSVEITGDAKEIAVDCQASGDVTQREIGKKTWNFSISAVDRQATGADVATNITGDTLFDDFVAGTQITVKFGMATAGDTVYTGVGFIKSWKLAESLDEPGTVDISGFFNSLVKSTVAA